MSAPELTIADLIMRARHFKRSEALAASPYEQASAGARADLAHLTLRRRMALLLSKAGR